MSITTINTPAIITPSVEVAFTWTPAGSYTYTAPNGVVITAPSATHGTALTFTATAAIDNQGYDFTGPLTIVEYRWDFGDGVYGYGADAVHTYAMANFQTQTALRLTDSLGRYWYSRAQMYLT